MNAGAATAAGLGMGGLLILAILISLGAKIGLAFIPANIAKRKGTALVDSLFSAYSSS